MGRPQLSRCALLAPSPHLRCPTLARNTYTAGRVLSWHVVAGRIMGTQSPNLGRGTKAMAERGSRATSRSPTRSAAGGAATIPPTHHTPHTTHNTNERVSPTRLSHPPTHTTRTGGISEPPVRPAVHATGVCPCERACRWVGGGGGTYITLHPTTRPPTTPTCTPRGLLVLSLAR